LIFGGGANTNNGASASSGAINGLGGSASDFDLKNLPEISPSNGASSNSGPKDPNAWILKDP